MAFMTGYQSIDGQPSTMNHWLLTEKLKEEWGFEGILVTDYDTVGALVKGQQVCADYAEAAASSPRRSSTRRYAGSLASSSVWGSSRIRGAPTGIA
jgi:hypothetical protein